MVKWAETLLLLEGGDNNQGKKLGGDESLSRVIENPNKFDSDLDGRNHFKAKVVVHNCANLRGDVYPSTTSWISVAVLIEGALVLICFASALGTRSALVF